MTFKLEEFRQYLKINKSSLDNELVQHSQLFFTVAEAVVEAQALRDAAKESLANTDALLDAVVRLQLEKRHDKVTEAMVKGGVQTHLEHNHAFKSYIDAKREADLLSVLKDSFEQRGHMIRDLCKLFITQYYDEGSVRGTNRTDSVQYSIRREALAEERRARSK